MVLLISYDLNGHERPSAYDDVKRVIEANAPDYRHPLYSQWLVQTSESEGTWSDRLLGVMDSNDNLLVCRIYQRPHGWMSTEIWDWLVARI
jgi:hypothetical protein